MKKDLILADLSRANTALVAAVQARDIGLVKEYRDMGEAAKSLTKKRNMSLEAQNNAAEFTLRAERELGKMIPKIAPHGNYKVKSHDATSLKDIGINKSQSSRWQQEAGVPKKQFDEYVLKTKKKKEAITQSGLLKIAHTQNTENRDRNLKARDIPRGEFQVIYADPPWKYEHAVSDSRRIENQYPTMPLEKICGLKIPTHKNSVLFLWSTAPKLEESLQVINAWGFKYRTCAVWDKQKIGMGYWFRNAHELILVAVKGVFSPPKDSKRIKSVISEPRGKHSEKPDSFRKFLENAFPNQKKLELFARSKRPGWTCWGNEL